MKYPRVNFKNDFFNSENKKRSNPACRFKSLKLIDKIDRGASPNFNEEKKLWKKGYKCVVGLDEAGRGPLAGPVVAAAVLFNNFQFPIFNFRSIFNEPILKQIKDSKQLTSIQREKIYNYFKKNPDIKWGVGIVSEKVIDKINILEATKLAMEKALASLRARHSGRGNLNSRLLRRFTPRNDEWFLLIDGNFEINSIVRQKSVVKGDQKVFSCALASIFAKVTRDKIMEKEDKKYPNYGFAKHKGYGTAFHFKMIKKHGPCKIHRKSFYPVSNFT